ncbi:hypothetical protein ACFL08_04065 [Patescibacteria group bacterium]
MRHESITGEAIRCSPVEDKDINIGKIVVFDGVTSVRDQDDPLYEYVQLQPAFFTVAYSGLNEDEYTLKEGTGNHIFVRKDVVSVCFYDATEWASWRKKVHQDELARKDKEISTQKKEAEKSAIEAKVLEGLLLKFKK